MIFLRTDLPNAGGGVDGGGGGPLVVCMKSLSFVFLLHLPLLKFCMWALVCQCRYAIIIMIIISYTDTYKWLRCRGVHVHTEYTLQYIRS